ncbi:MAG TPA: hypothetical protein VJ691_09110 [Vicinamibacterales bacterium]|nr:hypothetical protein [Vicinamibacterales bacterium]
MKCTSIAILCLVSLGLVNAAQAQTTRTRHFFGIDVFGRGGVLGLSYEVDLTPRLGVGAGAGMGWGITVEGTPGIFPIYLSWTPLGDTHRLYLGGGVGLAHVSSRWRGYFVDAEPRIGWSAYRVASIGYERRRRDQWLWRVTMNLWHQPSGIPGGLLQVDESGWVPAPAFTVGARF